MKNAIELVNYTKKYDSFKIENVNLSIPNGYITGFIGPNGSGKTTIIKSIMSLIKSDEGKIIINNDYTVDGTINNEDIAFVTDNNYLSKDWTAKDSRNVFKMFKKTWSDKKFYSYLKKLNIPLDKKTKDFSKGMQMKLMVAIALSYESKILILDEPTSGLDPSSRYQIMDLLQQYVENENKTILFSTHITSDLEQIADYIAFILDGEIIYMGTKDELIDSYMLVKGGLEEISFIKSKIIGLKTYENYFEGLIATVNIEEKYPLTYEKVSLDDLIVFLNRRNEK